MYLFTSEVVSAGHPDKCADSLQIGNKLEQEFYYSLGDQEELQKVGFPGGFPLIKPLGRNLVLFGWEGGLTFQGFRLKV